MRILHSKKNYKTKFRFRLKAFSLIELSFVILIIGVLVGGIVLGTNLISRSRITNAQTLSQSSPVFAISDLQLWIESSLDRSFSAIEMVDGNSISVWNNISLSTKVPVVAVGSGPVYSTSYTINSIPAVHFINSSSNYLTISDARFLNNTDYTICVTEKRSSNQSNNYFIGDTTTTTSNQNLLLGYLSDGSVIHSQADTGAAVNTNVYSSAVVGYAASSRPRLFCFVQNSVNGKSTYINGMLAATSNNTNQLSGIMSLSIGKNYSGDLGEVIIFTKALSVAELESVNKSFFANLFIGEANAAAESSELSDVIKYMSKKFNTKVLPFGTVCNGVIMDGGCDVASLCTTPAGTGYLAQSNLPYGSNSFSCNDTGYSGSKNYNCSAPGSVTITGGICSCAIGYTSIPSLANGCVSNSFIYSNNSIRYAAPNTYGSFNGYNGYTLRIQSDRNLTLYNGSGGLVWSSGSNNSSNNSHMAIMQSDGNLVVYDQSGPAVWASGTNSGPHMMVVGYNGKVMIYSSNGATLIWSRP